MKAAPGKICVESFPRDVDLCRHAVIQAEVNQPVNQCHLMKVLSRLRSAHTVFSLSLLSTLSPCLRLSLSHSGPRVEHLEDHACEVSWEALPPMKGDPIIYTLQSMLGNSDFKQVTGFSPGVAYLIHERGGWGLCACIVLVTLGLNDSSFKDH